MKQKFVVVTKQVLHRAYIVEAEDEGAADVLVMLRDDVNPFVLKTNGEFAVLIRKESVICKECYGIPVPGLFGCEACNKKAQEELGS